MTAVRLAVFDVSAMIDDPSFAMTSGRAGSADLIAMHARKLPGMPA